MPFPQSFGRPESTIRRGRKPVRRRRTGSRRFSLVAAALEEKAIAAVELGGSLGSLKEIIEQNRDVASAPELFTFGLLEQFDVRQLAGLVAPRPVIFPAASDRVKKEMTG